MDERKPIDDTSSNAVAKQVDSAAEEGQAEIELPAVESVSISPATETAEPIAPGLEIVSPPRTSRLRLVLRPRHKRHALLAATVAIAAAFGAVVGRQQPAASPSPRVNVAGVEENKAIQQSVARLSGDYRPEGESRGRKQVTHSQIAKISERLNRGSAEITGSITPPQTVPASAAPIPTPRPASAGADTQPPAKVSVVPDWSIRDARDGYVYVQGHGDIYEVVPGAPLPGLGPVEQIKRQDGHWVVVTPKGIIVSMRDRRNFEQF
jgi:hypothetical protein